MTKQEILDQFLDINYAYNDCTKLDTLSAMLDELLEAGQRVKDMARLITEEDFKEADAWGIIPAWIEYRPELESAEDGWELIDCNVFHNVFKRAWTQRPTDEQMEAAKWDE